MRPFVAMACAVLIPALLFTQPAKAAGALSADEAEGIAADAFVYGFAPILLETRRQLGARSPGGTDRTACAPAPQSPLRQVLLMDMQAFFGRLARYLKRTTAPAGDTAILGRMARIGIDPRAGFFDTTGLSPAARRAIEQGMRKGLDRIRQYGDGLPGIEGWVFLSAPDAAAPDHVRRAAAAYYGMGEPLGSGVTLAFRKVDAGGKTLNGNGNYALRFEKDRWPLDQACWVLSVRQAEAPWKDASLGGRDGPQAGPDGAVEIFLGKVPPGAGREANWLEAPGGDFTLILRSYRIEGRASQAASPLPQVRRMEE